MIEKEEEMKMNQQWMSPEAQEKLTAKLTETPNTQANEKETQACQSQGAFDTNALAEKLKEQREKELAFGADFFDKLMFPTLLFGILFTLCFYDNFGGIFVPIGVGIIIAFCFLAMKKLGMERKKGTNLYATVLVLLGISSCTTGNGGVIFYNTLGMILILVCMLLHNFCDTSQWNFDKYVKSILQAVFGAVSCIPDPFSDGTAYQKKAKDKKNLKGMYVVMGVIISLPILLVVLMLLGSADIVFQSMLNALVEKMNLATIIGIAFCYFFAVFGAYCGFRYLSREKITQETRESRSFEPIIAITVLTLLFVVYFIFSIIQILYLFIGKMALPEGYTYAEYAREGFFQLLAVCIFNVLLVLFIRKHFAEKKILMVQLVLISVCTYIMLASSAMRMLLYIRAYELTFARVQVLWTLALLAILLAGVLLQIVKKQFPLFRFGLVVFCIMYLGLSFAHVDYWVARYNLNKPGTQATDYYYLLAISTDAVPAVVAYENKIADLEQVDGLTMDGQSWMFRYEHEILEECKESQGSIRKFNISKAIAKHMLSKDSKR